MLFLTLRLLIRCAYLSASPILFFTFSYFFFFLYILPLYLLILLPFLFLLLILFTYFSSFRTSKLKIFWLVFQQFRTSVHSTINRSSTVTLTMASVNSRRRSTM